MERPRAAERIERLPFTTWQWGIMAMAVAAWIAEAIDIVMSGATLPSLKAQFHLSPSEIGAFAAAATSGIVITLLFVGILIDQFGKRKVLLIGMLVFGVGTFATAFVPSMGALLLLRFLTGLGLGAVFPIPYQYIVELMPSRVRGSSMSIVGAALFFGYFLNLLIASYVIPHDGWRPMYVIGGGITIAFLVAIALFMPESPRWLEVKGRYDEANRVLERIERAVVRDCGGRVLPAISETLEPVESKSVPVAQIFRGELLRRTIMVWVMAACVWTGFYFFSVYLPEMGRMRGFTLGAALLLAAVTNGAPIPLHIAGAWLLERWGRRPTIFLFEALGLAGIILFVVSKSYFGALFGAAMAFGFISATSNFTKLVAAEAYPTRLRGTGTAWMEAVARAVAGVAIPFILAGVLANSGIAAASAVAFAAGVIGIFAYYALGSETRGTVLEKLDPGAVPAVDGDAAPAVAVAGLR